VPSAKAADSDGSPLKIDGLYPYLGQRQLTELTRNGKLEKQESLQKVIQPEPEFVNQGKEESSNGGEESRVIGSTILSRS